MFHASLRAASDGRVRRGFAMVLASAVSLTFAAPALATSSGKRPPAKDPLERLWSEYPLNPDVRTPQPAVPNPSGKPVAGTDTPGPPSPSPPSSEPAGRSFPIWGASLAAAALALLLVLAVRLRFSTSQRSPLRAVRGGGGIAMSKFVRRLLGGKPSKPRVVIPAVAAGESEGDPTVERLQRYLVKGSEVMTDEPRSPSGDANPQEDPALAGASYHQLGERVSAILNAAEEAAKDIRRLAKEEADRTREEAHQTAAAQMDQVQRRLETERHALEDLRAELDRRSRELDEEADVYREQKRREAEAQAAEIRRAAEEAAKQAQGNAVVLQRWLEGTVPRFHEVTDWLERVVAEIPKTPQKEGEPLNETVERPQYAKSR